jgi:hypothetical protein
MFGWIANNPLKTAGLVILFIIVFLWANSGSSSGSSTTTYAPGYDPSTVAAGMQLQAAQSAQQTQLAAYQIQANAESDKTAAAVQIAELQALTVQQQNVLSADVAGHSLDVQYAIANSANTLQAAVATQNAQTTTQIAAMQAATNQLVVNAGTRQAEISADVMKTQILAASGTQDKQTAANLTIAKKKEQTNFLAGIINPLGCYLTTACVAVMNLPDDCFELTMMRRLRDAYVVKLPDGEKVIADYYACAPVIVDVIESRDDADEIFVNIHRLYIVPCAWLVQAGKMEAAYALYSALVRDVSLIRGMT